MSQAPPSPSLSALRCLEATVRLGSLSAAAAELHLTHGAVSRHLRNVERTVGRPLFERPGRRVVATPAARRLATELADALGRLDDALATAAAAEDRVVLSCEPTVLTRWLIPRLPAFRDAHPEVDVTLKAAGGAVPFRRESIDLALRRSDVPADAAVASLPLLAERMGPVCAPALAARIEAPDDLRAHPLLHSRTRPDAWAAWARGAGASLALDGGTTVEHFYIAIEAATAGLGVAIASWLMVADAIEAGTLAAPLGFVADGSRYELLWPAATTPSPATVLVRDWLAAFGAG